MWLYFRYCTGSTSKQLYDSVIIDGFLSLIICILSSSLVASADNRLNPFNQMFELVSKHIMLNVKIFKILIIAIAISGLILLQYCFARITQPRQYKERTTYHKFVDVLTLDVISSPLPEQSK